jgi:Glycosyltransferase
MPFKNKETYSVKTEAVPILFVTHSSKKGGAEQSLIHLINHLDPEQYQIHLLSPQDTTYLHEIRVPFTHVPIALESIRTQLGWRYLSSVLRMMRLVHKKRIKIVHANGWRAPWFTAPLRFVTSARLIWHHRDHTHLKMFNRVLPRFFHRVICISQFVAEALEGARTIVIYNGIDERTAVAKTRPFMADGMLCVGMIGRIVEWKRYELVIEALARLRDRGIRNCKLWIVGNADIDGSEQYYNSLKEQAKREELEEQVVFYGYTDRPVELMSDFDVTVNFSKDEPFGRVIIESLLAQTPVIVSGSGGAPEIIQLTDGGIVVEDGDVERLADALEHLMKHPDEYERLLQQGFQRVREQFNMNEIAGQVSKLYEDLLSKEGHAHARQV